MIIIIVLSLQIISISGLEDSLIQCKLIKYKEYTL